MNATLIAFPDDMDRSDREFDRTGSTDFSRAGDEATALYDDMLAGELRASLLGRVERLTLQVAWLETWRSRDCEDLRRVGSCWMSLSLAPRFLRDAVEAMPKPRPRTILRLVG